MGHRAAREYAVELIGDRAGRSVAAADVGSARAEDSSLRALRPAGAELQHAAALRRADDAVGLCGNEALVVQRKQNIRFNELRLDGRGADRQDRLAREDRRALRHGVDIAREVEILQIVQEALVKDAAAAEIGEVVLRKMQIADILDHLLQTCRNGKAAAVRNIAEEDVKIADLVRLPVHKVAVAHGQLVKIAEHGQIEFFIRFHTAPLMHMLLPRL